MVTINQPLANKNNLFHLKKHLLLTRVLNILWESVVSKVVVECGKKFYFNDSSEYKVSTADVTSMNIFKFSCASPRLNKYSNIRNSKNQVLPQKRLDHSVGLQQLSRFGISNQTANALLLKMINSRKKFHKQCSSFKSTKDLKT